jgi:hypothetical protein
MNDYAFFEYQAKLTNAGHAEDGGEPVHCMIRMKNVDRSIGMESAYATLSYVNKPGITSFS